MKLESQNRKIEQLKLIVVCYRDQWAIEFTGDIWKKQFDKLGKERGKQFLEKPVMIRRRIL